jgi:glucosamine-6-phosphate deaminase
MLRLNLLEETRFEKLPVTVYPDRLTASKIVAKSIADIIVNKAFRGEKAVLGLVTSVTSTLINYLQSNKMVSGRAGIPKNH